jgi:hypothetical protein
MSEFDRRAEAWLRAKYPGCGDVLPGTVEFGIDSDYEGRAEFTVTWTEKRPDSVVSDWGVARTLRGGTRSRFWDIDTSTVTDVMRELVEMEVPE